METVHGRINHFVSGVRKDLPIIQVKDVSLSFGKKKVLSHINFDVYASEMVYITGPSGSGKTSLLNILDNNQSPTSGEFCMFDQAQKVATVYQDLKLLSSKTLENNLMYSYSKKKYSSKNEFLMDLYEISKVLGIYNQLNNRVSSVNGGLKQKLAIARAILSRPNILLLDEPTSSMDNELALKVYDLIHFHNIKRKVTVIWATHNRSLVKQFSGRNIHLQNGKILHEGNACFI